MLFRSSRLEGHSGITTASFIVSLSAATTQTVTVQYATADGSAIAGSDYLPASGTLTFAPGQTNQIISVSILGDAEVEGDETFLVQLHTPLNATLATSQAAGTIQNDDQPPPDTIPPAGITALPAIAADGTITLSWANPADPDLRSGRASWRGTV